ncbi:MAG: S-methyl-5'-thioadenosine phosphorylase [Blastochloris sp.]|jgi:5'-methylthioadenosine phosphorylase|nr:S-methyl-5'-thioadenosine phosphorylase [Blastochloris sp.]
MNQPLIGIIGGSGLYHMKNLTDIEERTVETPFGPTSDAFHIGSLSGRRVVFLARHGRHHSLLPSELPHRANIWALKSLGVRWIISLSAVGSLKEELKPRHFVFPLQYFDRTKNSAEHTFFGKGLVAHVSFGQPVCQKLATILFQSATLNGATCHWGGTYVNMEGPAFSTLAECEFHRRQDFDVIGMTNLAEAKLSREAEISYATLAMVTDYDCWHGSEVNVPEVVAILRENANLAENTVAHAISQIPLRDVTTSHRALSSAIMTPRSAWPEQRIEELRPLLKNYL